MVLGVVFVVGMVAGSLVEVRLNPRPGGGPRPDVATLVSVGTPGGPLGDAPGDPRGPDPAVGILAPVAVVQPADGPPVRVPVPGWATTLVFVGPDCDGCRRTLEAALAAGIDPGPPPGTLMAVVWVGPADDGEVPDLIREVRWPGPVIVDPTGRLADAWGVRPPAVTVAGYTGRVLVRAGAPTDSDEYLRWWGPLQDELSRLPAGAPRGPALPVR